MVVPTSPGCVTQQVDGEHLSVSRPCISVSQLSPLLMLDTDLIPASVNLLAQFNKLEAVSKVSNKQGFFFFCSTYFGENKTRLH